MKIAIVGGGISGLATYHALRKSLGDSSDLDVTVYEAHPPTSDGITKSIGAGLGVAPNGLRALHSLSPSFTAYIRDHGFSTPFITFRNSQGTLLGHFTTGTKERYGHDQVYLARDVIHRALMQGIPEGVVVYGKRVEEVVEHDYAVQVQFADGDTVHADLVIGADGIRSTCRKAIFGDEYPVQPDGMVGIGGFLPISTLPQAVVDGLKVDPVTMTFGPTGFFGFAIGTPNPFDGAGRLMWWSTHPSPGESVRDTELSELRSQLLTKHANWKSPHDPAGGPGVFESLISLPFEETNLSKEPVLILPRYTLPLLPRWSSPLGRIVLVGDAAHAVPSDSGQGASCAIEDGVSLSILLAHFRHEHETAEAVKKAAKAFEELRIPRIKTFLDMAKRRGSNKNRQSWWQEWIRDWMLWLLCKLPVSINDRILAYDAEKEARDYLLASV